MEFRKKVEISKSELSIDYQSKLMLMGSCFAENIGEKFLGNKFNVNVNPFGILYNPASISVVLRRIMDQAIFSESELRENNGLFTSFMHHGSFSKPTKGEMLDAINDSFQIAIDDLKSTDIIIVTFGTAYVYSLKESGAVVANCHKFPASMFDRERMSVQSIVDMWSRTIEDLREINSSLRFLFTVSPIRHWKDGAHNNQLSKATLLLSIDELVNKYDDAYYFPSYEIVLDELRDYRFYTEDMVHPNNTTIEYIWEIFSDVYFDESTQKVMSEWQQISRAISHRPFNPNTGEHKQFLRQTLLKVNELRKKYPYFDLDKEAELLTQKLS